tara:strand:- start:197 stop:1150 length:954 start_codon:yes stop_codon:yes gene_type:complete
MEGINLVTVEGFSSIVKTQFLSLFDFGNPFTIYLWVMVIGFSIRFFLVIRPLRGIYKRFSSPKRLWIWKIPVPFTKPQRIEKTIETAKKFKEEVPVKGIEQFLITEIVLALAPIISAAVLRLVLGSPTIKNWTEPQMYILFCVFLLWLAVDVRQSIKIKEGLKQLDKWYADPRIANKALAGMTNTKKGLVHLSQLKIPEYREEEEMELMAMRPMDEEGNKTLDKAAILHNAKEIGSSITTKAINIGIATKSATKSLGQKGSDKLDEIVQKKVEEQIGFRYGKIVGFTRVLLMTFGPLVVLYTLPYSLTHILNTLIWW